MKTNHQKTGSAKAVGWTRLLCRITIIVIPFGIVCVLLGSFFLDKADYMALLKYNLLAIYGAAWLTAFLKTIVKPRPDDD
jgi:hypothetical protein